MQARSADRPPHLIYFFSCSCFFAEGAALQRLWAAVEGFLLSVYFLYLDVHLSCFISQVHVFRASLLVS